MSIDQGVFPQDVVMTQYKANMLARIDDIQRCKAPLTRIALRTVPWIAGWGERIDKMNRDIIEISEEQKLLLLDFDKLLWRGKNRSSTRHSSLFRDAMHPLPHYCAQFGLQYFIVGSDPDN
jgi:hypothetical protein